MVIKVGINGFGRIGRVIFRTCLQTRNIEVTAINDPAIDVNYICYLIKFDSTHGRLKDQVECKENELFVNGKKINVFHEKLPTEIPWHDAGVEYVIDASGMFTTTEKASGHLRDRVRRVVVTAPSVDVPMMVIGVNEHKVNAEHKVISCASSTLYCLAPIIKVLEDNYGVSEGFITSIHAMTPSLKPLDGLCLRGKHWRDHRSIHQNIIPASTGACKALNKIIPEVKDKLTGLAFRVPIVNVSVLDLTIRLAKNTTLQNIVENVEKASKSAMKNIIKISNEEAVSSDFVGEDHSCIVDVNSCLQLNPNFLKIICWYENEYSYGCRIIDTILYSERQYHLERASRISFLKTIELKRCRVMQKNSSKRDIFSQNGEMNPEIPCSASQDTGFKAKMPKRRLMIEKSLSTRNCTNQLQLNNREHKKRTEIFKIWNDNAESTNSPTRQNRSSFFHECSIPVEAPNVEKSNVLKTKTNLEKVKKEFPKLNNMNEHLLNDSNNRKEQLHALGEEDKQGPNLEKNTNVIDQFACNREIHGAGGCVTGELNCNNENHNINIDTAIEKTYCNDDKPSFRNKVHNIESTNSNINYNKPPDQENYSDIDKLCQFTHSQKDTSDIEKTNICSETGQLCSKKSIFNPSINTIGSKTENLSIYHNFEENDVSIQNRNTISINSGTQMANHSHQSDNNTTYRDIHTINMLENSMNNENNWINQSQYLRTVKLTKDFSYNESENSFKSQYTILTNKDCNKYKEDIYDKLDSASGSDSENSFEMYKKKSQIIHITDLTNSIEDLARLDKICKIIEISDELSDKLFSALNNNDNRVIRKKKWSFKDLCERIKLDEFCNKVFAQPHLNKCD